MSVAKTLACDISIDDIVRSEFWRERFPRLSIGGRLAALDRDIGALGPATQDLYRARMREEGYFQDRSATCERLAPALSEAVSTCRSLGIPPPFIFLFDEAWECFYALDPMLRLFLGDAYRILPDFWVWFVDPQAGEAGWRPHRDKGYQALAPDRSPTSLTIWIPLTEATPQNGCMYIVPANRDPQYGTSNDNNSQIDMPHIRALPGKPGDFICWNQAVLHWGAATSRFAAHPRISMALEFQRSDIPPWGLPLNAPFTNLSFEDRLRLIGKQILQYTHMYPLSGALEQIARHLVSIPQRTHTV